MVEEWLGLMPRVPLVVYKAVTRSGFPWLIKELPIEWCHMFLAIEEETLEVHLDLPLERLHHASNFVEVEVALGNRHRVRVPRRGTENRTTLLCGADGCESPVEKVEVRHNGIRPLE